MMMRYWDFLQLRSLERKDAHQCFDNIDDNHWMVDVLYQDVKSEFLLERKVKIRSKTLPWMNGNIRKIMNQRYQQLLKAQRTGDAEEWKKCKELRNKVNKTLKRAESDY